MDVIEFWANELFAKTVVHEEMGRRVWVSQEMALLEKLMDVIPELEQWLENHDGSELIKLAATGYEDLTVELLERNGEEARISLGHYRMNAEGKFVSDPSVIIELNLERKMAQTVRLESDGKCWWNALREPGCDQSLFAQLNCFLDDWLDTIQELGYEQKPEQRLELGL
ncbi:MAG: hypothetical protein P1U58_18765 [Verrucomicrobiales bacterium]|nr:hypothetical protein [Verrucomicrobiales bacterium]